MDGALEAPEEAGFAAGAEATAGASALVILASGTGAGGCLWAGTCVCLVVGDTGTT